MKHRPLLICFTGIDGTGKTTHALELARALNQDGIPGQYVRTFFNPLLLRPAYQLAKRLFIRGRDIHRDYNEYTRSTKHLFRLSFLEVPFRYSYFAEYWLHIFPRVRWPLFRGRCAVLDRYAYDAVVGLAADLGYPPQQAIRLLPRCWSFLPKPDIVFLMDLPEEVAFQRKTDTPSLAYLQARRRLYLDLAQSDGMVVLDSSRDFQENQAEVQRRVRRLLTG